MTKEDIIKSLHTDKLESLYGLVSARVTEHTLTRRIVDIVDAKQITRTHAITWFPAVTANDRLINVRDEIKSGSLAGKTFKEHGYEIIKRLICSGQIKLNFALKNKFATNSNFAFFQIYQFIVLKNDNEDLYGTIAEIDTPELTYSSGKIVLLGENIFSDMLINYLSTQLSEILTMYNYRYIIRLNSIVS